MKPWTCKYLCRYTWIVYDGDGDTMAECDEEAAKEIVRRANRHDEMEKAIRNLCQYIFDGDGSALASGLTTLRGLGLYHLSQDK